VTVVGGRRTLAAALLGLVVVSSCAGSRSRPGARAAGALSPTKVGADPAVLAHSPDLAVSYSSAYGPVEFAVGRRAAAGIGADGAVGANSSWEQGATSAWLIGAQSAAEPAVISGLAAGRGDEVAAGVRAIDWGFAHQSPAGEFPGTSRVLTGTAEFIAAAAHVLLLAQAATAGGHVVGAPLRPRTRAWVALVHAGASWLERRLGAPGTGSEQPGGISTSDLYVEAAAMGLAGLLTGDRSLVDAAAPLVNQAVAAQTLQGVNPEVGRADALFQGRGLVWAEQWEAWMVGEPETPAVAQAVERAVSWLADQAKSWAAPPVGAGDVARALAWWGAAKGAPSLVDLGLAVLGP